MRELSRADLPLASSRISSAVGSDAILSSTAAACGDDTRSKEVVRVFGKGSKERVVFGDV